MNVPKILSRLVPDFQSGIAERRKIRAAYQKLRQGLKSRDQALFIADCYDDSTLGIFDGKYHQRTLQLVEEGSILESRADHRDQKSHELSIPKDEIRDQVSKRANVMIWLLTVRNIFSYIFWTVWILLLISATLAIGVAIPSLADLMLVI